jgi:hypothetical protein
LNGLNRDIANVVELQHYIELQDKIYMAIKYRGSSREKKVHINEVVQVAFQLGDRIIGERRLPHQSQIL